MNSITNIKAEPNKRVFYSYNGQTFTLQRGNEKATTGNVALADIPQELVHNAFASVMGQRFTQAMESATMGTFQEIVERFKGYFREVIERGSFNTGTKAPRTLGTKLTRAWLIEEITFAVAAGVYAALRANDKKAPQPVNDPLPSDFVDQLLAKFQGMGFVVVEGKKLVPNAAKQLDFIRRRKVADAIQYMELHGVKVVGQDDSPDMGEFD